MLKNTIGIAFTAVIATSASYLFWAWPQLLHHPNNAPPVIVNENKPRILLVCLTEVFGGGEVHVVKLYQELRKNNYHVTMLTLAASKLTNYLKQHQLPHYTTTIPFSRIFRPLHHLLLGRTLAKLCTQEQITIVNCNTRLELPAALATKKSLGTKVVFTRHLPDPMNPARIKNIDAIIAVSKPIAESLRTLAKKHSLSIKHIKYIPALFDAEKFLRYTSQQSREDFFQSILHKKIHPYPVICMIANFYRSFEHKNHPLMIEAVKKLVDKQKPVYVVFAGDGQSRPTIERMIHEYRLDDYIYCLGFYENTAALLHHSDMMVLTSKNEALGIVYLEAGLMKKPAIGARGTGAESILIGRTTGLLFKNNDVNDLVAQIEYLIDHPIRAQQMGKDAYRNVIDHFNPDISFEKTTALYELIR